MLSNGIIYPAGTEAHTAQPIGFDRVVYVRNGNPALCRAINLRSNKIEREFVLHLGNPESADPGYTTFC